MRKIQNVAIAGLGAVGASYAAKIHDWNPKAIQVIVNEERLNRYRETPCRINGKTYHFQYVLPEEAAKPADLVLIGVKYPQLLQGIEDIRNHVGPDTTILSLLNGIDSEEIIGQRYGMEKLLYATCVGIDAVRKGTEIKYSTIGEIHFGERDNTQRSPRVQAVKELFEASGIPYTIPTDMLRALWWKFMVNVGINQPSAILRAPYRAFQEIPEAIELMEAAMLEVISLANKMDVNLQKSDIQGFQKVLATLGPESKTSMLQDIESGRKTEVDMLGGVMLKLGKQYGVETPVNRILVQMIQCLEKMQTTVE
ncbi:MAG: ketopantoate reductase family protein [Bacillota bacterium]